MTIEPIAVDGATAVAIRGPDGIALVVAERDGMLMWMEVPKGYRQRVANSRNGKASAEAKRLRAQAVSDD